MIAERLNAQGFPYAFRHINFEHAGHLLNPLPEEKVKRYRSVMAVERQHPKECAEARQESFTAACNWVMDFAGEK